MLSKEKNKKMLYVKCYDTLQNKEYHLFCEKKKIESNLVTITSHFGQVSLSSINILALFGNVSIHPVSSIPWHQLIYLSFLGMFLSIRFQIYLGERVLSTGHFFPAPTKVLPSYMCLKLLF